jgi:hypothetical protein
MIKPNIQALKFESIKIQIWPNLFVTCMQTSNISSTLSYVARLITGGNIYKIIKYT